jgi:hypothetical protein
MNAKRKTYGVSGYMEWVALIPCGKATVKVHFSGGSLTGYGVTPAEFTTQNPMTQAIIENSKEFKSGKIFLLREIEGTGKFKEFVRGQHANEGNHLGGQAATASAIAGTALDDKGNGGGGVETPTHKEREDSEAIEAGCEGAEGGMNEAEGDEAEGEETVTADGKAIIDVSDIDDARDYLCENFGIARSSLRSNVSVYRAAEEHNIVFRGIE